MTTKHVYLGRFAPFHNGHKLLLGELVSRFGSESVLVMIGSTNTINRRTPYTYEDRKEILGVSFPNIEVLPLPDGKPNLVHFDGTTNEAWLDSIEEIARSREEEYVFYGGSTADLEVLAQRFRTEIIISREVLNISATMIRSLIENNDLEKLVQLVDPNAVDIIISKFRKFI